MTGAPIISDSCAPRRRREARRWRTWHLALALLPLVALSASGCATKARAVRARAAGDFACPAQDIEITSLGGSSYRASGCGDSATYTCLREAPPPWAYGNNGAPAMWSSETVCVREGAAPASPAAAAPTGTPAAACPPGTQWNGSVCVARVVVSCPQGSRFESGVGCVADSTSREEARRAVQSCPRGMALVTDTAPSAGEVDAVVTSLCVDRTEVTSAEYDACVLRKACSSDGLSCGPAGTYAGSGREQHPINCVSWGQAAIYCREQGKRLPTSQEWEWMARGGGAPAPESAPAAPGERACWSGTAKRESTCVARENEGDATVQSVLGLTTNVSEWTSTGEDRQRVVRGGHFASARAETLAGSASTEAGRRSERVGFRCVTAPGP